MKRKKIIFIFFLLMGVLISGFTALNAYAQEAKKILSIEAYDMLNTVPDTYLVDVRTRAEYQLVGHPSMAYLFPYVIWKGDFDKTDDVFAYQLNYKNKAFIEEINKAFKKTDNLLIISRDGTRSALVAKILLGEGYKKIFDVEDGFEGNEFPTFEDDNRNKFYKQLAKRNNVYGFQHRRHNGWQYWGLPWTYEIDPKYIYPPDLKTPIEGKKN